jgi:ADP-heptose:LPS heptosyltransferase
MLASIQRLTREPQWRRPAAFIINGIGDHLMALPALRALASLMQGRLRLLCVPTARDLFFSDVPLAAVHDIHHLGAASAARARDYRDYAVRELAAAIGDCDLFLCFERHSNPSTTALLRALKPEESIGLLPGFDIEIPFHRAPHAIDLAFAIPMELTEDLRIEDFAAPPKLPNAALALARKLRADLPREAVLLAVHTDTKPEKTWSPAKLAQVLNEFLELHRHVIAIVVGVDPFRVDIGRNRGRVLYCHGVPLSAAFAIIGVCDLFLGVDSCMLHMADLCGVPGIGLFGSTDPSEFGFRFAPHMHVRAATMNEISVAEVANALEALWRSVFPHQ